MSFLHPWIMVAGVAAASLPVLVHFLTRPRPVREPLSTLRFVRELLRQRSARSRLRDALVLLLRTAAILAIAAAIARPNWGEPLAAQASDDGDTVRVVVLDVSASMGATDGGFPVSERARSLASEYLRYRSGLRANLLLAGSTVQAVFEQPSANFEALREELQTAQVRPQRLDVRKTLEVAARMLSSGESETQRRRELIVVSDFQRKNWAAADFSVLPADTHVELSAAAPAKPLANLAIVRAECRGRAVVGRTTQLEIEVGNYSPVARDVAVEAALGDGSYRLKGTCQPGRTTTLVQEIPLRQVGWQWGQAKLVGNDDALTADDVRPIVVDVRPRPLYALITRQAESQSESSSFFLERALVPDAKYKERASARLVRMSPDALDREALAPTELIALDHPGKLDEASIKLLAMLLRRGRPLLYVAADPIDAVNLKLLAENVGRAWQLPVEFAPPPAGQSRQNLFLASYRRDATALRVFGNGLDAALGSLRFSGGLASRKLDAGLADDVLATYSDGSAAIVLSASDAGSVLILNADLATSNLSNNGAFVPLLEELVQQALEHRQQTTTALCGERLTIHLPAEVGTAAGLKIVGPNNADAATAAARFGDLSDDGAGVQWQWPTPTAPGVYRVVRDETTVYATAVSLPDDESQLEPLPPEVFAGRLAGGRAIHFLAADSDEPAEDRLWTWLCVACVGCMLGELGVHLIFKS